MIRATWHLIGAVLAATLAARGATAGIATVAQTGAMSPLDWVFSSLSQGIVDGQGRAVFTAGSSGVFARTGGAIVQRLGPGTLLADGRRVIGADAGALDANECVVARTLLDDGGQAIVRVCGEVPTVIVETGDVVSGGSPIQLLEPTLFVAGIETIAFAGTLADQTAVLIRRDTNGTVVVARSGQAAPSGGTFGSFRLLGVSAAGRVAFHASVSQGPDGLFAAGVGGVVPVALVGQAAPSGGAYAAFGGGSVNPGDRWVFRASLSGRTTGIFRVDVSAPALFVTSVVLEGEAAPIQGARFRAFPSTLAPSINAAGAIAFRGLLTGVEAGAAVFVVTPDGAISSVVMTRQQTPVGLMTQLRDPAIADDGSLALPAKIAGSGFGLFAARDGDLHEIAQFSTPTTSDVLDTRFRFSAPAVRASTEGSVFLGQREGIFRTSVRGVTEVIAYTGQRSIDGGTLAAFGPPVVDGRGRVVFGATVHQGSIKEAVFVYGDTGLTVLAEPGQRASGGGTFSAFFPSDVDDAGRSGAGPSGVALTASLEGTKADEGMFLFEGRRGRVVARTGQRISGKRVAALGTPAFGARRQLAFVANVGRKEQKSALVAGGAGSLRVVATSGAATRTRLPGSFLSFDPPAMGSVGAIFRATLSGEAREGIFVARGKSIAALASAADATSSGDRIRSLGEPTISGSVAYFLARLTGEEGALSLYRVVVDHLPKKDEAPSPIEPMLSVGTAAPSDLGGVITRVDQLGAAPDGAVTAVLQVAGGKAASAIVSITPDGAADRAP